MSEPSAALLEMGNVRLRAIADADSANIVAWRNNERVRRNFIFQEDFTVPGQLAWMETQVRAGRVAQFVIEELDSGNDVGSVFIRDIDRAHRKGEFGIFIGDDSMRGRGVGTSATQLTLRHGFEVLGLNKIFLRVFADNGRAIRSYEKSGFVREGLLRDDVFVDGRFRDVVLMSVLKEEWT